MCSIQYGILYCIYIVHKSKSVYMQTKDKRNKKANIQHVLSQFVMVFVLLMLCSNGTGTGEPGPKPAIYVCEFYVMEKYRSEAVEL